MKTYSYITNIVFITNHSILHGLKGRLIIDGVSPGEPQVREG